jgi:hypothetical protein
MKHSLTKGRFKAIAAASLAALAVAATATGALAGGNTIGSQVNVKFNSDQFRFTGHVKSEGKCERQRLVRVYEKAPGEDDLVGADTTDSGGKFSVNPGGSINGGTPHYAKAIKKELNSGKTCLSAKSDTFVPND